MPLSIFTGRSITVLAAAAETELRQHILPFWLGLRDPSVRRWLPPARRRIITISVALKGAVLHARILWAFSSAHLRFPIRHSWMRPNSPIASLPNISLIPLRVECSGRCSRMAPRSTRKHVYAQAFAIYGLVPCTDKRAARGTRSRPATLAADRARLSIPAGQVIQVILVGLADRTQPIVLFLDSYVLI